MVGLKYLKLRGLCVYSLVCVYLEFLGVDPLKGYGVGLPVEQVDLLHGGVVALAEASLS